MDESLNVLTHHKCASTWLTMYLSEFSKLNAKSLYHSHNSNVLPDEYFDITELTNASYEFIKGKINHGIHIIRNPLDIVISAYFSHMNTHPIDEWPELAKQRNILQSVDKHNGLFITLSFLERDDFYAGAVGPLHAMRHWDFNDPRFTTIRMEDMVSNPENVFGPILAERFPNCVFPSNNNYTFESIAGRKPGEIDNSSHYRSGRREQWRDELPEAIVCYIVAHYWDVLERFYPESARQESQDGDWGPGQRWRARSTATKNVVVNRPAAFIPIGVLEPPESQMPSAMDVSASTGDIARHNRDERPGMIEIDMVDGTRLRVDASVDEQAFRRVLGVLKRMS